MRTSAPPSFLFSFSRGLRLAQAGLVASLILASAGCQSTGFHVPASLRWKEVDGAKVDDPWTKQAGSEGRAGRPVEKQNDPLNLRKYFMSEKALEIEANCGIE